MIDVVFQLIIFFLVSSHLAKHEAFFPLPLPIAQTGQPATPSPSVTIHVLSDGRLRWQSQSVSGDRLEHLLADLARNVRQPHVRIRADRHVAYRHIQPILTACWKAGITEVEFSVYRQSH